MKIFKI